MYRTEFHPNRTIHMERENREASTLLIELFATTETIFTRNSQLVGKLY